MKQPIDTDGMTPNEVLIRLGWTKGQRVQSAGIFQGYEIFDASGQIVGVFSASQLWKHLRKAGLIT